MGTNPRSVGVSSQGTPTRCQKNMKKYSNDDVRKLNKTGSSSYSVVIPKEMIKKLGWRERQKVKFVLKGKTVLIRDFE